jgi:ribosomal protein S18 acetylase RimI-like enzyme
MPHAFIRLATPADIPALNRVLVATWHATYDAIYGAATVDDITGRWHSPEALALQLVDPSTVTLLAERDGVVLATASSRRLPNGVGLLARLYVSPEHQGGGVGRALHDAAIVAIGDPDVVELKVEPANARAVGFYRRLG